jgi:RNA-directed DNA polymerase
MSYKAHMHGSGESHSGIVPTKRSNEEPNPCRTQSRESGPSGLDRVRQAAQRDKQLRLTALLHHVTIDLLRSSYYDLKRRARRVWTG